MIDRLQHIESWVYRLAWVLAIPLFLTVQLDVVSLVFMGLILLLSFVGLSINATVEQLVWM
jgi:hypothetical protein